MLVFLVLLVIIACLPVILIIQRQNFEHDLAYLEFTELFECIPDVDVGEEINDLYITDEHEEYIGIESFGTGSL